MTVSGVLKLVIFWMSCPTRTPYRRRERCLWLFERLTSQPTEREHEQDGGESEETSFVVGGSGGGGKEQRAHQLLARHADKRYGVARGLQFLSPVRICTHSAQTELLRTARHTS